MIPFILGALAAVGISELSKRKEMAIGGLVPTATNGEEFAKGGGVGEKVKLEKELHKLQRELNSSRLRTYRENDTSEEEQERQKERAEKLNRFNEILNILNTKYESGGGIGEGQKKEIYWNIPFHAFEFEDGMIQIYHTDKFIKIYAKDKKDAKFIVDNLAEGRYKGKEYLEQSKLYMENGYFYIKNGSQLKNIGKNKDKALRIFNLQKLGASFDY